MTRSRFDNRTVLITGGARGIGRALVRRFLEEGARVVLGDCDEAAARDACDEYDGLGPLYFVPLDVSDEAQVQAALAATRRHCGGLDVLVNNAAIADPGTGPIEELSLDTWNRYLATNLTGAMLMTKHAVPMLRRSEQAAIIQLGSTRALQSEPETECYAAAKGGLAALTHALAVSLSPRVRVNCVLPGWIATAGWAPRAERAQPELSEEDHGQHPAGRVGTPEDVAALCAFLASSEAGFITGAQFVVDGGMTRKMIYRE